MKGFTLIELLTTLCVISLLLFVGLPSFTEVLKENRLKTSTLSLIESIETTRSVAVFNNQRALLLPKNGDWEDGWIIFLDLNDDGLLNPNEDVIRDVTAPTGVTIEPNTPVTDYISFIGSGEGRKIGKKNGGSPMMGTLKVCPLEGGEGYALILSRGGRTRLDKLASADCASAP